MTTRNFDLLPGRIWYDGEFVPAQEASLHVMTHALHYASAVFEGERVYGGRIFRLRAHTERLVRSARLMGFELPWSVDQIDQACRDVVADQGIQDGYVRPIAWRGSEMMGVSAQECKIHVAIACWEWPSYFDPQEIMKGIRMQFASWRRPDPATSPVHSKATGLYMICTLSKHEAEANGYSDALMLDWRGRLAEATGANLFLVQDGVLHTPEPDCFLDGITRRTVMELAARRGIEVVERAIMPEELAHTQEVFLTGTAVEVTPVREIGPYHFTPGEVTRWMVEDYSRQVREEESPQAGTRAA